MNHIKNILVTADSDLAAAVAVSDDDEAMICVGFEM